MSYARPQLWMGNPQAVSKLFSDCDCWLTGNQPRKESIAMFTVTSGKRSFESVPLQDAVLCSNCEVVSNGVQDKCPVCGSNSLVSLVRMLGGTLQGKGFAEEPASGIKYDLSLTLEAHAVTATDLNHVIDAITRLANPGTAGVLERFHVNVDPVVESAKPESVKKEDLPKAA